MVVGSCGRGSSSHGEQEAERQRKKGAKDKTQSQGHSPTPTELPTSSSCLKFPEPPKIVLPVGDMSFSGGHFVAKP
jgi:hypothetical protein